MKKIISSILTITLVLSPVMAFPASVFAGNNNHHGNNHDKQKSTKRHI
jgi:hypothetical protein